MNASEPNNDGPRRFARNWLMFNEARPTRPRLLRNFIAVVAACFAITALLAIVNAVMR